jgi:pilus assembly protein FimV
MSLRYVVRMMLLAGLVPAQALALGLGDIHLKSPLNAPLVADIDLNATPEELDGLKVTLASRDSFARYGLDYPSYLAAVTVEVTRDAAGHNVIQVRSRDAITEPFATLLVEANWPRGRLVHEYTVLLDPPVFTGAQGEATAVAAPASGASDRAGTVGRAQPEPAGEAPPAGPPTAPAVAAPAVRAAAPGDYSVRRGDTLSAIVARHYSNAERDRALVAAYRANPSAFEGNMNVLRAGSTLHLPPADAVAAIGPADAKGEVLSQYRAWSPARPSGQLKLVPPEPVAAPPAPAPKPAAVAKPAPAPAPAPAAAKAPDAGAAKAAATAKAEADAKRLLELRNADLAKLQSQSVPAKPAPAQPSKPEAAKPAPAASAEPPKAEATPAPKPLPKPAAKPAAAAPESGGIVDLLVENWMLLVGALVAIGAAVVGFGMVRKRQSQRMERTFEHFSSPPPEAAARNARATESTQPIKALHSKDDQGFLVEESGTHEILALDENNVGASVDSDSPVPVDSTVSLEQGDPLAEADFHMAYGLYDQAADLVRLAISREPGRQDLKLKLLEVYFVWGNKDQFLHLARELANTRADAPAGEWEKVVIMGRQIAPEDGLFSAGDKVTGAASGGVDLNLEGGQNHVDFDLLGEPTMATGGMGEGVDLDLGAALKADVEATGEAPAISDTGVDFILDDPNRGGDSTGITREMPQTGVTLDFSGGDAPTVEQPYLQDTDHGTLRTKLDASSRSLLAGAATEQTTELALDDLGLDLSADATGLHAMSGLEATGTSEVSIDSTAESAPTLVAGLDDETRRLIASAGTQAGETQEMPSSNASGTWLISDQDFSEILPHDDAGATKSMAAAPTQIMPANFGNSEDTGTGIGLTDQIQSLRAGGAGVDLNLDGLDASATGRLPALDLDLGAAAAAAAAESRFSDTQRLDAISIPPPSNEIEPATMSEVGTKLDLARAYMDMGDPEGARSILEEVLSEGSASQKTEARRLIDSLPG